MIHTIKSKIGTLILSLHVSVGLMLHVKMEMSYPCKTNSFLSVISISSRFK